MNTDSKEISMIYNYIPSLTMKEQQELAESFCEGSETLKNLLSFLWKHNINTIGCCSGHEGKSEAYISICLEELNKEQTKCLIKNLLTRPFEKMKWLIENRADALPEELKEYSKKLKNFKTKRKCIVCSGDGNFFEYIQNVFSDSLQYKTIQSEDYSECLENILSLLSINLEEQQYKNTIEYINTIRLSSKRFELVNLASLSTEFFKMGISNSKYKCMCRGEKTKSFFVLEDNEMKIVNSSSPSTIEEKYKPEEIFNFTYPLNKENVDKIVIMLKKKY